MQTPKFVHSDSNDIVFNYEKKLYSFDIFETIITRKVAVPNGIFDIMQQVLSDNELIYNDFPEKLIRNFATLRIEAAKELENSRFERNVRTITLDAIYQRIAQKAGMETEKVSPLIELEQEMELQNCVGIEGNIQKIVSLMKHGKRVILISDMYLDSKVIRDILVHIDHVFESIPIYVSSEEEANKKTGELYILVRKREKINYNDWLHIGNHPIADKMIPNDLGIATEFFAYETLTAFENTILNKYYVDSYVQYALGTSRNLRLKHKRKDSAYRSGASVGGFILYPYVRWLLSKCQKKGIKRLYFLSRDGYILQIIANIIIAKLHLDLTTHYLYVSRRSLYVQAFDGNIDSLKLILNSSLLDNCFNVKDIATILFMKTEELCSFLPEKIKNAERFSFWQQRECFRILYNSNEFRKKFYDSSVVYQKLASDYLRQEIDTHDEHFAFVDINAGGMSLLSIKKLMENFYTNSIKGFFFTFNDRLNLQKDPMFDISTYMNKRPQYSAWIELLTRALHGMTVGYKQESGLIVDPILNMGEGDALKQYGYDNYVIGVKDFCEVLTGINTVRMNSNTPKIVEAYISAVFSDSNTEEFQFFADMPFEIIGLEKKIRPFAPRFSKYDLRRIFLYQSLYEGAGKIWDSIRLARCNDKELKKINFYENCREQILLRYSRLWKKKPYNSKLNEGMPESFIGKRIVLYGAGNYGKMIYRLLSLDNRVRVVAWLDKKFESLRAKGIPVTGSLNNIEDSPFDFLIISLLDNGSVKKQIIEYGIPEDQIFDIFI